VKARNAVYASIALIAAAAAAVAGWQFAGRGAGGTVVRTAHAEAELVAARDAAEPGQSLLVALRLKSKPGWHTYWRNPGDSGQPTSIEWRLPAGVSAGPIGWPVPQRFPIGPLANYGYQGEVLLATEIRIPSDAKGSMALAATAKWLSCDPDHCIPESGELALRLPVGRGAQGKWGSAFDAIPLPRQPPAEWRLRAVRERDRVWLELAGTSAKALFFFPYAEGKVQPAGQQMLQTAADGMRLSIPVVAQAVGEFARLAGVLVIDGGHGYEIDVPIAGANP